MEVGTKRKLSTAGLHFNPYKFIGQEDTLLGELG